MMPRKHHCDITIFGFGTRPGHSMLTFGRPRDKVIIEEDTIDGGRFPSVRVASPVSISVYDQC
jgi:hypothetical protein